MTASTKDTLSIGDVRLDAIYDTDLDVDIERAFPNVPPGSWASYREYLTDAGRLRLVVTCYLIHSQGQVILCDTGMGVVPGTDQPGKLLENMRARGVQPDDVDMVVFTHLHRDHVGWNTQRHDGQWRPVFPNARHIIQRAEWDHFMKPERRESPAVVEKLLPIQQANLLELNSGDHPLTSEVKAVVTAGHSPGHTSLVIESRGQQAFVQGDLAVHHILLPEPNWEPRFDFEPAVAKEVRRRMLEQWERQGALVVANHFPYPGYGHVVRSGYTWKWNPL